MDYVRIELTFSPTEIVHNNWHNFKRNQNQTIKIL
nr:MAG TPA: hypothetical protein [Caudoviricetes sp.]